MESEPAQVAACCFRRQQPSVSSCKLSQCALKVYASLLPHFLPNDNDLLYFAESGPTVPEALSKPIGKLYKITPLLDLDVSDGLDNASHHAANHGRAFLGAVHLDRTAMLEMFWRR